MTKKDHRIKARDTKGQSRAIINGYGVWKPWLAPRDWTDEAVAGLGHRPGVYMVRAITAPGMPVNFTVKLGDAGTDVTPDELKKRASPLQGVLYIGKAVDLTSRFGNLAFSWQSNPPFGAHTSASNYLEKDAAFWQQFPANMIELRCMPIGTKDWTEKSLAGGLLGISQKWFWKYYPQWTQGHGNSEMDQTCAAAISRERSFLCLYHMVFGAFPPLNKRTPKMNGVPLDAAWLTAYLATGIDPARVDPDADAAIEMNDSKSDFVKDAIQKDKRG